jgi:hypothetical protein
MACSGVVNALLLSWFDARGDRGIRVCEAEEAGDFEMPAKAIGLFFLLAFFLIELDCNAEALVGDTDAAVYRVDDDERRYLDCLFGVDGVLLLLLPLPVVVALTSELQVEVGLWNVIGL